MYLNFKAPISFFSIKIRMLYSIHMLHSYDTLEIVVYLKVQQEVRFKVDRWRPFNQQEWEGGWYAEDVFQFSMTMKETQ